MSQGRWDFLNTFNTTAFKGWSVGWLWVYTGVIWGAATLFVKEPPEAWLVGWLAGLTAYSGVSAYQYTSMRNTDYGALERKAQQAPAPAPQTTTVNVAGSANVSGETKP